MKNKVMKSVCFVATSPFAVNAFLLNHLRSLADFYRVTLCVNLGEYPISEFIDPRVRVLNVGMRRKISPISDVLTLFCLFRIFRQEKFDAVHSITPKAGLLAMCAAALGGVPKRFHTFTGQVWATRQGIGRVIFKSIDSLVVNLATRVFSDSVSQSRFLEAEGLAGRGSISVLGKGSISGVDELRFRPNEHLRQELRASISTSENSCVFLFVGRLVRDKGVFDLVRAFSRLSRIGAKTELWFVGPDEDGLQKELQQLKEANSVVIRWFGPTFAPENFMAAADVLVLPSYREGFGLVIAEAASCGIPAVAYRIDGVIDAVDDGNTGILAKVGDVDKLSEAMKIMLINPDLRCRYGQQALERVHRYFSQKAITSAWLLFYEQTMRDSDLWS